MVEIQVDEWNVTASDYAIYISGLPPNYLDKKQIPSLEFIE